MPCFLYEKYGYYKDAIKSIELKGMEGLAKIKEILETLRQESPKKIGSWTVQAVRDYREDTVTDLATGEGTSHGASHIQRAVLRAGSGCMVMRPAFRHRAEGEVLLRREGALLWQRQINYLREMGEAVLAMINKCFRMRNGLCETCRSPVLNLKTDGKRKTRRERNRRKKKC